MHLPCERNDRLDCLKFPSCSLVQGLNEYRCTSFRPRASSLQTIWIIRKAQSCCISMTHPVNDLAITPSWYRLHFLAFTHIMFLKKINKAKEKKITERERESERRCDAINFQAACKACCSHLECVHREEYELNLDNFLVLQQDTGWLSKWGIYLIPSQQMNFCVAHNIVSRKKKKAVDAN